MILVNHRPTRRIARTALAATLALAGLARTVGAQEDQKADSAREARLAWFREAKYGLFIHWGLYAIPAGEWKGKTMPGIGEWIMNRGADPGEGIRAARHAVQSGEVRRRRVGEAREGRRDEVHRHHLQASRRLRDVQVEGQPVQHRRRDAVQARRAGGARRRVREARDATRLLLLAVAGLARAGRRGQHLGLRPRRGQALRRLPARQGRAAGARAAHQLRSGRADLVRHAAHDDRRSRVALHALVRTLQPNTLIDGRLGESGDYVSTGDNVIPSEVRTEAWEVPATLNHTWGYRRTITTGSRPATSCSSWSTSSARAATTCSTSARWRTA